MQITEIFALILPLLMVFVIVYGLIKKVNVYEAFIEGAKKGLTTAIKVMPYIATMLIAISVFRASGGLDLIIGILQPVFNSVGVPAEIVPLALLRPFSGGASMALLAETLQRYGPDSFVGRLASTMMGSTETIFYTVALYFGSVGIKNVRHTIVAALIAEISGLMASVFICHLVFT